MSTNNPLVRNKARNFRGFIVLILILLTSACSLQTVKPWHRDILAKETMQLDVDEFIIFVDDQTYYSKEASHGGAGIGGGGCGCN